MNSEKRTYYRPFRSVAGFLLGIGAVSNVLTVFSMPLQLAFAPMLSEELLAELFILLSGIVIIYTYYLCKKIFLPKYVDNMFEGITPFRKGFFKCVIECVLIFAIIRVTWHYHTLLLDKYHLLEEDTSTTLSFISIIYVGIFGPIAEELVFRGWLLNVLKRYGNAVAIIITSIGFGLFHGTLAQAFPAFIIGILFAFLAIKYKSLLPVIILHIANNLLSSMTSFDETTILLPGFKVVACFTVLYFLFVYRKEIVKVFKGMPKTFELSIHSISFILFIIMYIVSIIITALPA